MNDWRLIRLIAGREISERVRGRLIRVMTVAMALLVAASVAVPSLIKGSSAPSRIGLVGSSAQMLAPTITRTAARAGVKLELSDVADQADARGQLTSGRLDAALIARPDSATVEVKESLSATVRAVIQAALDDAHLRTTLAQAGIRLAKVAPSLQPVPIRTSVLEPRPADQTARDVAAIAAGLVMYVAIALYGGAVATGVAQEKTSRTAEVLLAAVRPRQLLTGKVLGIGATALGQLAIAAGAGLIADVFTHSAKIPGSVVALLPSFLVCFLAGFALYAFALAAAGAMVSRQEEVQVVTTPIGLPLLIGYLLVYAAIGSPDATWFKLLSFFPPLTPTLFPARIALGHTAPWEFVLAAVIMLASIAAMVRLASRIYARGLIQSGPRLSWRAALQLQRERR